MKGNRNNEDYIEKDNGSSLCCCCCSCICSCYGCSDKCCWRKPDYGQQDPDSAELKADNYEVTLPIGVTDKINSVGFGVTLGDGLSYVKLKGSVEGATVLAAASESGNFIFAPFAYASVPLEAVGGQIAEIKVKVSESAKPGDTFTLSIDGKDSDGVETSYKNGETGETGVPGSGAGTITIVEDPTEPTTEATTAAPTATPVVTTTTAAKVATPTKPAKSTSSPKTGDALPVAGVAVAVAVIGGVALVAKKRK